MSLSCSNDLAGHAMYIGGAHLNTLMLAVRGAIKCLSLFSDELEDDQVAQVRI